MILNMLLYVNNLSYTYIGPPAFAVEIMKNTESSSVVVHWDEVEDSLPTTGGGSY